ncbi:LysR family transcriptional regulator [Paenibacillus sp. J45TS6]|uniref:LysR family transcriptional regulator n=1 Tax=Paenibacillus sp. J45TS6 TaxID=2807196 RepID=UPI001B16FB52|nr:LysR family transcriptional regulator [Paenibacillus sp. J45TS6]GIP44297.1 LysR family transcriptional regulator [Paenibacillus sp. J45TS6]
MITDTLRVFVTVAELRHFSKAAESLNLSQPGVSLHIRNLENEMGAKLLHRSSKQVRLTEAGEILYKHAKQMMHLYDEAKQSIRLLQHEVTGQIRLGASFTIGEYILPGMIADYAKQYPHVNIEVTIRNTEEIMRGIREGMLDIGLVEGKVSAAEWNAVTPFMKDQMILIAPSDHPLARERVIESKQLQDQIWVLRESGSGTRAFSDQFIAEQGLRVKQTYSFCSSQGVKEAVVSGLGIALLSEWIVQKEIKYREVAQIHLKEHQMEREFSMVQSAGVETTLAHRMFIQHLLTYVS